MSPKSFETESTMCFSCVFEVCPGAPGSFPPCPGSITTVLRPRFFPDGWQSALSCPAASIRRRSAPAHIAVFIWFILKSNLVMIEISLKFAFCKNSKNLQKPEHIGY